MRLIKTGGVVLLALVLLGISCENRKQLSLQDDVDFSFHEQNFGESAGDLLRADKYKSLRVEIHYMTGFRPDMNAIANLRVFLNQCLNKPEGVKIFVKEIAAVKDTLLTRNEVDTLRRANRVIKTKKDQIAIYILYTNGQFHNKYILGQAFRNTTIIIYGKSLRNRLNAFEASRSEILETELLLHEFGHLLGLVNKGSPMMSDHDDRKREAHCENEDCIMYAVIDRNQDQPLRYFDEACLQDLAANSRTNTE
ncbi:zinc metalloprotease [Daejeonella lutea]|uniref:Membrane metalloprotease n=1 Tax=Daejeonella lutea TaxID=572036 RepID=A0A1T5ABK2_9SPHI|nr:hypothetical protein [Daejeonella lutea]SKB32316.1 hypothetical protein SAMN05661099_0548 [Daejeonella lutea]